MLGRVIGMGGGGGGGGGCALREGETESRWL